MTNGTHTCLPQQLQSYLKIPAAVFFTSSYIVEPQHIDRWSSLCGFSEGPWMMKPDIEDDVLMDCLAAFHSCTAIYRREIFEHFGGFLY